MGSRPGCLRDGIGDPCPSLSLLCRASLSSSESADQRLSVSHCPISASVVTVLCAPRSPHRSPGIIYLHPEFIRNHPVSLTTGLGSRYRCLEIQVSARGCYSVYHTPPGSSFRNHSLQSVICGGCCRCCTHIPYPSVRRGCFGAS